MTEIGRAHSGFADLLGYRLTECKPGYAEITLKIGPQHLNRLSVPHGGVLATLLDSAAGFAAAFADDPANPRTLVTLSINTMFLGQARVGETIVARGKRVGGGKTIAYATAEVTTTDGRDIARAEAVFKYVGQS
ncbi:MAG TPA: PaaI family thioesterase [Candidatus Cybelea sp.]|nr:PaaI family thioesterase [Candidatus Cybelea sp.]